MHKEASDKHFWIIGLLVAAGVFAGIHIFKGQISSQISSQANSQSTVRTVPPVALATEHSAQSSSSVTQPALMPQTEPAISVTMDVGAATPQRTEPIIARVYECVINGQRVFSDQVCAADARQRDISAPNRMAAQEAAIGYRAVGKSSAIARQRVDAESSNDDVKRSQCDALLQDKNYINSRMRAGYTNNEGERLRARLRKIDSDYYDLRCRTLRR